jgi:hypothetical protein
MASRTLAQRFNRRGRAALFLLVLVMLTLIPATSRPADAIDISVVYDPTVSDAVDPCGDPKYQACPDGVPRTDEMVFLVQVAAAYWASIFHDSHLYDIRVAWKVGGLPESQTTNIDASGHPTSAIVRVPADMYLWYDPTPFDDDEFAMEPRLYRDTHPAEQAEAFDGAPPEIFEVGFNGSGPSLDLLTILLHELGHSLGLDPKVAAAGRAPACDEQNDPYYHLDPALLGGAVMSLKAYEIYGEFPKTGRRADDTSRASDTIDQPSLGFDCAHLALGGIQECNDDVVCEAHQALMWYGMLPNARARPSVADILAVATAGGWHDIHLPRKYSLASGNWTSADTWLGAHVPNSGNNVYILNQEDQVQINLFELGQARDVVISDGNTLNVTFGTLDAYSVTMSDGDTTLLADSGATIDAVYLTNGEGGLLDLANDAFVDVFWTLRNDGTLRGGDSVVEAHDLENRGVIRANGGVLTLQASQDGPAFDLDGTTEWPFSRALDATAGDLVFDGVLTDPLSAAVTVGDGHAITFTHGWQQTSTGVAETALRLDGQLADATVHGDSSLAGNVIVDGRGRFSSPVTFEPSARLEITLGGLTPVSGHDQLVAEQLATLDGALDLALPDPPAPDPDVELGYVTPGFFPNANDAFVIMTYAAHSGEFAEITGWDLGALRLYPEYDATQLRIVARLVGDANGDGVLTNQDKGALAQSYGPCAVDPVPCVADIDADGDIDHHDLQLLKDLLK